MEEEEEGYGGAALLRTLPCPVPTNPAPLSPLCLPGPTAQRYSAPKALHSATSSTQLSHQHSLKLGRRCCTESPHRCECKGGAAAAAGGCSGAKGMGGAGRAHHTAAACVGAAAGRRWAVLTPQLLPLLTLLMPVLLSALQHLPPPWPLMLPPLKHKRTHNTHRCAAGAQARTAKLRSISSKPME